MTPEQFTYWLQGFLEISNPTTIDEIKVQIIKDHLNLVFKKQTPDRSKDVSLLTTLTDCGFRGTITDTIRHKATCKICNPIDLAAIC